MSRRVRVPGTCISSIYLRKMPKREHKEGGGGGTSMSEHNAGCGVQPNYYFTRRSYTRWYESRVALGYSFLSRYNCRVGMSRCDLTNNIRFVSFRRAIHRFLDISSCCYSNKNMNWDCFFDIEKKRSIYMYILWILGEKKKRNDWFMPTMNDKIIYRFIVVLIKNGKIYILEIFCIKIYSIIVFQNNGGVFEICNKSGGWFFIRFS